MARIFFRMSTFFNGILQLFDLGKRIACPANKTEFQNILHSVHWATRLESSLLAYRHIIKKPDRDHIQLSTCCKCIVHTGL